MARILRTASALQDIDGIWDHIAVENHAPDAADRLVDDVDRVLRLLTTQPQLGEAVDHLRPNTRRCIVQRNYLLFYDIVDGDVRLLRVLHAARLIRPEDLQV